MNIRNLLAVTLASALIPSAALAGGGPSGPTGPVVSPVFNGSTGAAGYIIEEPTIGFIYGYTLDGVSAPAGEGAISVLSGFTSQVGDGRGIPDFDGNGVADLVILNSTTGQLLGLLLDASGGFVTVSSQADLPGVPTGAEVLGYPDLDGDGNSDLVIQDPTTGVTSGFIMDGLTVESSGQLPGLPTTDGFETIGFPDLDGDGSDDMVIQSDTGFSFAYLMNGLSVASQGALPSLESSQGFSTAGFPDLDGDDDADLVLEHTGGFIFGYELDGLTEVSSRALASLDGYSVAGFPDLDPANNNGADLVIQHTGGFTVGITTGASLAEQAIGALPSLATANGFSILGFPNLDAAGSQDLVFQHTGGFTYGYILDGAFGISSEGALPDTPAGYTALNWGDAGTLP